jgi:glyoxylate carboligase
MRYAIIENGTVVNVVIATAQFAAENDWIECPDAGPGWTYANGVFTAPVAVELTAPTAPTKEQLMAELAALTAKIQALE